MQDHWSSGYCDISIFTNGSDDYGKESDIDNWGDCSTDGSEEGNYVGKFLDHYKPRYYFFDLEVSARLHFVGPRFHFSTRICFKNQQSIFCAETTRNVRDFAVPS